MAFEAILWRSEGIPTLAESRTAFEAAERTPRTASPDRPDFVEVHAILAEGSRVGFGHPEAELRGDYIWVQAPWDSLVRIGPRLLAAAQRNGYTLYAPIGVLVPPGGEQPEWVNLVGSAQAEAEAAFATGHAFTDRSWLDTPDVQSVPRRIPGGSLQRGRVTMSFDLCIWRSQRRLSEEEAQSTFERIARGIDEPAPEASLGEFLRSVSDRGGGLDGVEITHGRGYIMLNVPWHRADEVAIAAQEAALELGLTMFDPQNGVLVQPIDRRGA